MKSIAMDARPVRMWALLIATVAAAALLLSFGCGAGNTAGDNLQNIWGIGDDSGGGDDVAGGGGEDGGDEPLIPAGGTNITITSTLSQDVTNEGIDPDASGMVTFMFDSPMDAATTAEYVTVFLQELDDSYTALPSELVSFAWKDAQTLEMKWPARYKTVYMIDFAAGWKTIDATASLSENLKYVLLTVRNPFDINGDAADTADVVMGYEDFNDGAGAGFFLPGEDLIPASARDMPLWLALSGEEGGMDPAYFSFPDMFYTDPAFIRTGVGRESFNLGNVSGNWRSDFVYTANRGAIEGACFGDGEFCNWTGICAIDSWCWVDEDCPEAYACNLESNNCESTPCEGGSPARAELILWDDVDSAEPTAVIYAEGKGRIVHARPVGDVNGDGRADFVVTETSMEEIGLVQNHHLFLGRSVMAGEIPVGDADATWDPYQDSGADPEWTQMVSATIAPIGDFNGDGLGDFAVASVNINKFSPNSGIVSVHYGASNAAAIAASDLRITSATANDRFGAALSGGDVDGDGKADLLVGAPALEGEILVPPEEFDLAVIPGPDFALIPGEGDDDPPAAFGKAYLFKGAAGLSGTMNTEAAEAVFSGAADGEANDLFGYAVAAVDLDSNGFGDVVITAPAHKSLRGTGRVYIYNGEENFAGLFGGDSADAVITHDWPPNDIGWDVIAYALGDTLVPTGDIDNDGYKDLLIYGTATSVDWGDDMGGFACIFLGGETFNEFNLDCDNASAVVIDTTPLLNLFAEGLIVEKPR